MKTNLAPICDECPHKDECTFMCQNRIDQFCREEELADIHDSLSVAHNVITGEEYLSVLQSFDLPDIGPISLVTQVELVEAPASSSSPKLINQDKYVGIERSHWTPREPMPLSGFAVTISGKTSPKKHQPASEVIALPRQKFQDKTIFPKNFPVPVVCSAFCDKLSKCNVVHTEFEDLCKNHHKTGKLVRPVDIKWSVRFSMKQHKELKAKVQFAKSAISGTIPEIALANERTEDSTFAAYSSQTFLDTFDEPADGNELEYTMDIGMVSPDKFQAGAVPSFMYRTIYRDRKILVGFDTRIVEKTYVETERRWIFYPPIGGFILGSRKVIRTTRYKEHTPVYKWIQIPTLRPIGCYLKPMKVIGSTTVVTQKERKVYQDRLELQRQNRHHERVLIRHDETNARKQVVPATC